MKVEPPGNTNLDLQGVRQNIRTQKDNSFKNVLEGIRDEEDDKQLRAACQEFEALFVYELLKQMRASIPKGGLIPEGIGEKMYKDMLDEEYSKIIAASPNSLGLGDLLYRQLKRDAGLRENNEEIIKES